MRTRPALATTLLSLPLLAAMVAAPAVASDASTASFRVITSGLDNPRGLAAHGNSVYVAEGGHGDPAKCIPDAGICVGLNSQITRVSHVGSSHATKTVVVGGLVSIGNDPSGVASSGAAAVTVRGHRIAAVMSGNTAGAPPTLPPGFGDLLRAAKAQLGQVLKVRRDGTFEPIAGVGDFDYRWTDEHKSLVPDQFPDSNPNGLLADGRGYYVADAGANTLDSVRDGRIRVVTFFGVPEGSPTDAVPTCVSRGPDGALYVGELLGGTFAPGGARVWRVVPGQSARVWATGLTAVNGCGWGPDGKFYAVEFQTHGLTEGTGDLSGDVVQLNRNGEIVAHLGAGQLFVPSGFAAHNGHIYVSNCSIAPATGFGPCPSGGQLVSLKVADED